MVNKLKHLTTKCLTSPIVSKISPAAHPSARTVGSCVLHCHDGKSVVNIEDFLGVKVKYSVNKMC